LNIIIIIISFLLNTMSNAVKMVWFDEWKIRLDMDN